MTLPARILFAILFFQSFFSNAQGFLGKHVVVKTAVINGVQKPFGSVHAEVILGRTWSATLGYYYGGGKLRYEIEKNDVNSFINNNIYSDYIDIPKPPRLPKVSFTQSAYSISLSKYFSEILPAPSGGYFSLGYTRGSMKVTGTSVSVSIMEDYYGPKEVIYNKIAFNAPVKFSVLDFTFGVQEVFGKIFTYDLSMGLAFGNTKPENKQQQYIVSGVANSIGPNLLTMQRSAFVEYDENYNGKYKRRSVGISASIKLGVLLF